MGGVPDGVRWCVTWSCQPVRSGRDAPLVSDTTNHFRICFVPFWMCHFFSDFCCHLVFASHPCISRSDEAIYPIRDLKAHDWGWEDATVLILAMCAQCILFSWAWRSVSGQSHWKRDVITYLPLSSIDGGLMVRLRWIISCTWFISIYKATTGQRESGLDGSDASPLPPKNIFLHCVLFENNGKIKHLRL